jgi:hypothetical protein
VIPKNFVKSFLRVNVVSGLKIGIWAILTLILAIVSPFLDAQESPVPKCEQRLQQLYQKMQQSPDARIQNARLNFEKLPHHYGATDEMTQVLSLLISFENNFFRGELRGEVLAYFQTVLQDPELNHPELSAELLQLFLKEDARMVPWIREVIRGLVLSDPEVGRNLADIISLKPRLPEREADLTALKLAGDLLQTIETATENLEFEWTDSKRHSFVELAHQIHASQISPWRNQVNDVNERKAQRILGGHEHSARIASAAEEPLAEAEIIYDRVLETWMLPDAYRKYSQLKTMAMSVEDFSLMLEVHLSRKPNKIRWKEIDGILIDFDRNIRPLVEILQAELFESEIDEASFLAFSALRQLDQQFARLREKRKTPFLKDQEIILVTQTQNPRSKLLLQIGGEIDRYEFFKLFPILLEALRKNLDIEEAMASSELAKNPIRTFNLRSFLERWEREAFLEGALPSRIFLELEWERFRPEHPYAAELTEEELKDLRREFVARIISHADFNSKILREAEENVMGASTRAILQRRIMRLRAFVQQILMSKNSELLAAEDRQHFTDWIKQPSPQSRDR